MPEEAASSRAQALPLSIMYQERPSSSGQRCSPGPFCPFSSPSTPGQCCLFSCRVLTLLRRSSYLMTRDLSLPCPAHSRLTETESSARQAGCCGDSGLGSRASIASVPNLGAAFVPALTVGRVLSMVIRPLLQSQLVSLSQPSSE